MQRLLTIVLAAAVSAAAALAAQSPPPVATAAFEVASVKPNNSGEAVMGMRRLPGGFNATNAPVAALVGIAYELQPFQMDGGPDWLTTARYDVTARMADGADAGPGPVAAALRALLADRFKLTVHWESRERPVFVLTVARADGTLGPNLKPAPIDCAARQAEATAAAREGRPAPPPLPPSTADSVSCGLRNTGERILFGGYSLAFFVSSIGNELGRMVIDRTGLTGVWAFELRYARHRQLAAGVDQPSADPDAPSIFTALSEQLGLKLEATNAPVPMLVIDHVERPTPD
jgi:uncharacterized protein (TIGR03435 family)